MALQTSQIPAAMYKNGINNSLPFVLGKQIQFTHLYLAPLF